MTIYKAKIVNWEKFNPRNDQRVRSWYRMQNDFLDDPFIYSLSLPQLKIWLHFLAEQNKATPDHFAIDLDHIRTKYRLRPDQVLTTIDISMKRNKLLLDEDSKNAILSIVRAPDLVPTNERTNERMQKKVKEPDPCTTTVCDAASQSSAQASSQVKGLIAFYCELFKRRYRRDPIITGKDAGIAKILIKDLGIEKAKAILETFFKSTGKNDWYLTKAHSLTCFKENLNAIIVETASPQKSVSYKTLEAPEWERQ